MSHSEWHCMCSLTRYFCVMFKVLLLLCVCVSFVVLFSSCAQRIWCCKMISPSRHQTHSHYGHHLHAILLSKCCLFMGNRYWPKNKKKRLVILCVVAFMQWFTYFIDQLILLFFILMPRNGILLQNAISWHLNIANKPFVQWHFNNLISQSLPVISHGKWNPVSHQASENERWHHI